MVKSANNEDDSTHKYNMEDAENGHEYIDI
jgi:hypothetical protein